MQVDSDYWGGDETQRQRGQEETVDGGKDSLWLYQRQYKEEEKSERDRLYCVDILNEAGESFLHFHYNPTISS